MNKNKKIINISGIVILILITFLLTRQAYNKSDTSIVKEYYITKTVHTIDSTNYYNKLNDLNNKLITYVNSNELLKKSYINLLNEYNNAPDSIKTILQPILINSCDSVVNKQDSIIDIQNLIIKQDSIYIKSQETTISRLDSLFTASNELLQKSNDNLLKTKKKLIRTRKLGIIGTIGGFITGMIIKIK